MMCDYRHPEDEALACTRPASYVQHHDVSLTVDPALRPATRLVYFCGRHRTEQAQLIDDDAPTHVDYPHEPGRLYGCPACEATCHCVAGTTLCVRCAEFILERRPA